MQLTNHQHYGGLWNRSLDLSELRYFQNFHDFFHDFLDHFRNRHKSHFALAKS